MQTSELADTISWYNLYRAQFSNYGYWLSSEEGYITIGSGNKTMYRAKTKQEVDAYYCGLIHGERL